MSTDLLWDLLFHLNNLVPIFYSHFVSVKITLHPALHRTWMPMSDAIDNPGTICPVRIIRRPGMLISHSCVE